MQLIELLKLNNITITAEQESTLIKYVDILKEWNEKFNLIASSTDQQIYLRHIVDSLSALYCIKPNSHVCDIGSGGGFPIIPLLIIRQDISAVMIDSVGKKVTFLNHCIEQLKLNATALHLRSDQAAKQFREKFDTVTARAVAKLNTLSEYCLPLVKVGGNFIAYKAETPQQEYSQALNAVQILGGKLSGIDQFKLTDMEETLTRSLIIIIKVSPTPLKYPRGGNKERISPL